MKLALDGMGGDNAPKSVVEGALLALNQIQIWKFNYMDSKTSLSRF